jgi:hypothetical protein
MFTMHLAIFVLTKNCQILGAVVMGWIWCYFAIKEYTSPHEPGFSLRTGNAFLFTVTRYRLFESQRSVLKRLAIEALKLWRLLWQIICVQFPEMEHKSSTTGMSYLCWNAELVTNRRTQQGFNHWILGKSHWSFAILLGISMNSRDTTSGNRAKEKLFERERNYWPN